MRLIYHPSFGEGKLRIETSLTQFKKVTLCPVDYFDGWVW